MSLVYLGAVAMRIMLIRRRNLLVFMRIANVNYFNFRTKNLVKLKNCPCVALFCLERKKYLRQVR